mmetsp:Transcript_33639/g.81530  ORF Transcript_33639/g.81530 Transcript_33639/m.81530 type:complete len:211 (+) Transcript_33639:223-855(+)
MTPFAVLTRISSSSRTIQKQLSLSIFSKFGLNLMAMTPPTPRPVDRNSSVLVLFPYPCFVMHKIYFSFFSSSETEVLRTFISAIVSPSFSFMARTPLLLRPVGRNFSTLNRVACPREDAIKMSSSSVHGWHHFNLSPSPSEAMVSPRAEIFSNASSGVRLIHPCSVVNTIYSFFENSDTGRIVVIRCSVLTGRTEGIGVPFAVLVAVGTW